MRDQLVLEWIRFIDKARSDATSERQNAARLTVLLRSASDDLSRESGRASIALHYLKARNQDHIADLGEVHLADFEPAVHAA